MIQEMAQGKDERDGRIENAAFRHFSDTIQSRSPESRKSFTGISPCITALGKLVGHGFVLESSDAFGGEFSELTGGASALKPCVYKARTGNDFV